MKEIKLTQDKVAFVDDEDFEWLNKFKWCAVKSGLNWYAVMKNVNKTVYMHRLILNASQSIQGDHRNGNGLDNQKENIRLCTHQQNHFNIKNPRADNKIRIKGVRKVNNKFRAVIEINNKQIHLGYFTSIDDANIVYRQAEVEYFGEFARESSRLYIKILSPEYQMSLAG